MTHSPALSLARGDQPETDLEVKRSHFLARAQRTDSQEEARDFIASVRAAHPTARHHCSAFTVPQAGAHPIERSNDDGEPSGTAGQPILEVLRGTALTSTTVVVTRYFGGTLLGTGGLVRAYSQAAAQALDAARRVQLVTRHLWQVRVPVAQAGRLDADLRRRPSPTGSGSLALGVEATTWGATYAVLTLSTSTRDAAALTEVLAAATQGDQGTAPEYAGTAVVEEEVPRAVGS